MCRIAPRAVPVPISLSISWARRFRTGHQARNHIHFLSVRWIERPAMLTSHPASPAVNCRQLLLRCPARATGAAPANRDTSGRHAGQAHWPWTCTFVRRLLYAWRTRTAWLSAHSIEYQGTFPARPVADAEHNWRGTDLFFSLHFSSFLHLFFLTLSIPSLLHQL
jgi:hypothetical protein